MARETLLGNPFRPIVIFDVDRTVSTGRINHRPDVMLVQFFINRLIRAFDLRDDRKPFNQAPDNPLLGRHHGFPPLDFLVEDGFCGKNTGYAIKQYQKERCRFVDGAVDPVFPLVGVQPLVIDTRMMFKLNHDHLQQFGKVVDPSELPAPVQSDLLIAEF